MKKNLQRQSIKLLKELHLPMFREYYAESASKAMQDGLSYLRYSHLSRPKSSEIKIVFRSSSILLCQLFLIKHRLSQ